MNYIGEYLLTNNSIANKSDTVQKQFIFTPDMYNVPSSDLENIFAVKNNEHMPHRYDTLSENSDYIIDTIEISKKVTQDDGDPDKFCSYIVTATYDKAENVRERDAGGGSSSDNDKNDVDEDGNKVTENTPPWKRRATVNFQTVEVKIPFKKAYATSSSTSATVDVLNKANQTLTADTSRYRQEISFTKNVTSRQTKWDKLVPVVNSDEFHFTFEGTSITSMTYPSGTVLFLPPAYQLNFWAPPSASTATPTGYLSYNLRMIYDPEGWDKKLLNVGTWAKFSANGEPEQIYKETIISGGTSTINFVNLSTALQHQKQYNNNSNVNYSFEAVTEDIPLKADGTVWKEALLNPAQNPYLVLNFIQYKAESFLNLIP